MKQCNYLISQLSADFEDILVSLTIRHTAFSHTTTFRSRPTLLSLATVQGGAEDKTKNIKIISYFKEYSRATAFTNNCASMDY